MGSSDRRKDPESGVNREMRIARLVLFFFGVGRPFDCMTETWPVPFPVSGWDSFLVTRTVVSGDGQSYGLLP